MIIRPLLAIGLSLAATLRLAAVGVGDSYEKVVEEKGTPTGVMKAGEIQILRYADQTINLKGGTVVSITAARPAVPTETTSVRSSEPMTNSGAKPPAPESEEAPGEWTTNYAAALEEAKTSNRHTFLFFTGSDWCGWCKRLVREILATPEFTRYAKDNLVLVKLDYPRKKPQPAQLKAQNAELAQRYKIGGYPKIVVLDSDGKEVGRLGYDPDGPKAFLKKLRKM